MCRFNDLLIRMKSLLPNLTSEIQGLFVMSQELDSMHSSLMNNQVPKSWKVVAHPSLKPLASWIKDLNERVPFMASWLKNGNPHSYWTSGFFFRASLQ
jgi:dynein heavy chain, axonemal